ncbi:TVP38/TMEM64 family protein [Cytobacillus gottheilii]|nr:VTT domain-containing protein [Cytobacillus gottheilii]
MAVLLTMVETAGILAPMAFILFHIVRQFLFIPVPLVCVAGGVMFGSVFGALFSLIGLTLSSFLFFFLIHRLPNTHGKLSKLKKRWFGEYRNINVSQAAVLRLVPFLHYHLISFCIMEKCKSFPQYAKATVIANIPLAVFYTVFGQFISRFTPTMIIVIIGVITLLCYLLREKVTVIKWTEFFKEAA